MECFIPFKDPSIMRCDIRFNDAAEYAEWLKSYGKDLIMLDNHAFKTRDGLKLAHQTGYISKRAAYFIVCVYFEDIKPAQPKEAQQCQQ